MSKTKPIDVSDLRLNCDAINTRAINFYWYEGYTETWEEIWPSPDGLTGAEIRTFLELHESPSQDDDCEDRLREAFEQCVERLRDSGTDAYSPMMNYYYPLPGYRGDEAADQARLDLAHLPLVLVHVGPGSDYETVLALSGGGMDLSWEICRAFVLLGYWPPVEFCRLPQMADKYDTPENRRLIAICRESVRIARMWLDGTDRDLEHTLKGLRKASR